MSTTNPTMSSPSMIETSMTNALGRFLDVDVARYKLVTTNLANIDTPGYRTRDLDFRSELRRAAAEESSLEIGHINSASFEPVAHPVRGLMERPDGNNVSVERESLLMAQNQLRFQVAVQFLREQFRLLSTAINEGKTS